MDASKTPVSQPEEGQSGTTGMEAQKIADSSWRGVIRVNWVN